LRDFSNAPWGANALRLRYLNIFGNPLFFTWAAVVSLGRIEIGWEGDLDVANDEASRIRQPWIEDPTADEPDTEPIGNDDNSEDAAPVAWCRCRGKVLVVTSARQCEVCGRTGNMVPAGPSKPSGHAISTSAKQESNGLANDVRVVMSEAAYDQVVTYTHDAMGRRQMCKLEAIANAPSAGTTRATCGEWRPRGTSKS
jgi:hypothetical protein